MAENDVDMDLPRFESVVVNNEKPEIKVNNISEPRFETKADRFDPTFVMAENSEDDDIDYNNVPWENVDYD